MTLIISKCSLTSTVTQSSPRPMTIQCFQNMNLFLSSGTQLTKKKADMAYSGKTCTLNGMIKSKIESLKMSYTLNGMINPSIQQLGMNSNQEILLSLLTNSRNQSEKNNSTQNEYYLSYGALDSIKTSL